MPNVIVFVRCGEYCSSSKQIVPCAALAADSYCAAKSLWVVPLSFGSRYCKTRNVSAPLILVKLATQLLLLNIWALNSVVLHIKQACVARIVLVALP